MDRICRRHGIWAKSMDHVVYRLPMDRDNMRGLFSSSFMGDVKTGLVIGKAAMVMSPATGDGSGGDKGVEQANSLPLRPSHPSSLKTTNKAITKVGSLGATVPPIPMLETVVAIPNPIVSILEIFVKMKESTATTVIAALGMRVPILMVEGRSGALQMITSTVGSLIRERRHCDDGRISFGDEDFDLDS